jgi:hypothetical protein
MGRREVGAITLFSWHPVYNEAARSYWFCNLN